MVLLKSPFFWLGEKMSEKLYMDEKYQNFLLLADNGNCEGRAYAFKFEGKTLYLEDIPFNYPSVSLMEVSEDELREIINTLKEKGWNIRVNRLEETD